MADSNQPIQGSCHCGNIRFALVLGDRSVSLGVRECGCTFCQKHAGVWTSDPSGSLRISVSEPDKLHKYRFGTGTAEFYVCRNCGVVPAVLSDIGGSVYAVVNVNAFDDIDGIEISSSTSDFSGESIGDRIDRRKRNWTPVVED